MPGGDNLFEMPKSDEQSILSTAKVSIEKDKMSEEKELLDRKRSNRVFGCFNIFIVLWILIIFFFLFILRTGATDNLIFRQIGLDTKAISVFVQILTNLSFIVITLILLVFTMYEFSKFLFRKSPDLKRLSLIKSSISIVLLAVYLVVWFYILSVIAPLLEGGIGDKGRIAVYPLGVEEMIDPVGLIAPVELTFRFTGLAPDRESKYRIVGYLWDLDGSGRFDSGKSGKQVNYSYMDKPKNPNFEVSVKVELENMTTKQRSEEIYSIPFSIAHTRPLINLRTSKLEGLSPLEVTFDATSSYDSDGFVEKFEWDFDSDGTYDEFLPKIVKIWDVPGQYNVKLKLTDDDGYSSETTTIVNVKDYESAYDLKFDFLRNGNTLDYTFDATNTDPKGNSITKYSWTFSGVQFKRNQDGKRVSMNFPRPGLYEVTLEVTGDKGVEKLTKEVDVVDQGSKPEAIINLKSISGSLSRKGNFYEGEVPLKLELSAENSKDPDNNIISFSWDVDGDLKIDLEGSKAEYTYFTPGTYKLTLNVQDKTGFLDTKSETLVLTKDPYVVNVSANPTSGNSPLIVEFDASASTYDFGKIEKFKWDFDDGSPVRIADAKMRHEFSKVGIYDVRVTAIASDGKEETQKVQIVVGNQPISVRFIPTQAKGVVPLSVTFYPEIKGVSESRVRWTWDFGDGKTSSEKIPSHTFESRGTFPVSLRVVTMEGTVAEYTMEIVVE